MFGSLLNLVIYFIVVAVVIYIVSWLNLGLTVDSFMTAIRAAIVPAVAAFVIPWLLGLFATSALLTVIVSAVALAVILLVSGRFLKGLKVNGLGALIATIAIAFISWGLGSGRLDVLGFALAALILILAIIIGIGSFINGIKQGRI